MAENSAIEWTDNTFNCWWCCDEVSPACDHCYARTLAARSGWTWGADAPRRFFGPKHWQEPLRWNERARKGGKPERVFCASMADVFEILPPGHADHEQMETARGCLWKLIEETPHLIWQLLTKRPKNILPLVPRHWREDGFPTNVWVGTTCENQEWAEKRLPHLCRVPAVVRFVSAEPLLGPLDLTNWLWGCSGDDVAPRLAIHLVIAGGESGQKARPSHPDWFRSLRDQCQGAGVAYFFKQWGEFAPLYEGCGPEFAARCHEDNRHYWPDLGRASYRVGKPLAGRLLDGRTWDQMPDASRPARQLGLLGEQP